MEQAVINEKGIVYSHGVCAIVVPGALLDRSVSIAAYNMSDASFSPSGRCIAPSNTKKASQ